MLKKVKVAFVLQGRFEAFELAKAMIGRGFDVRVLINYPKWAAKKFGLIESCVWSNTVHGLISRIFRDVRVLEPLLHRWFGCWAARKIKRQSWDAVFLMSGVAEETLQILLKKKHVKTILIRASSHICEQTKILKEEKTRTGAEVSQPSQWMIAREEREYKQANYIRVISKFSLDSFLKNKVDVNKLWLHPSAFPLKDFKASSSEIVSRRQRILSKKKLRILYVGALSFRKGLFDLVQIIKKDSNNDFEFKLVGPETHEALASLEAICRKAAIVGKVQQKALRPFYAWADIFLFPTLEDGFPQVLAQAFASGLPIITTTNCSAAEVVRHGETGWIFPIRSAEHMTAQLLWCDRHRNQLADMVSNIQTEINALNFRTWEDAALEAEFFLKDIFKDDQPQGCSLGTAE